MDVRYINPFIESVYELFNTMLSSTAERGQVGVGDGKSKPREITALIGMSGRIRGMVALAFPVPTALKIAGKLMGTETRVVDETVTDSVAECVNIVSGAAKAKLNHDETPIDLSLPTVVRGQSYNVEYPSNTLWLDVPFQSDLGPFHLRVTLAGDPAETRKEAACREGAGRG